jgi:hypothetical protein
MNCYRAHQRFKMNLRYGMPRTYYVHLDHNIGLFGSHVHGFNSHTILVSLSHYSLIYSLPGGANVVSISRICTESDLYQQETWKVKFVLVGPPPGLPPAWPCVRQRNYTHIMQIRVPCSCCHGSGPVGLSPCCKWGARTKDPRYQASEGETKLETNQNGVGK